MPAIGRVAERVYRTVDWTLGLVAGRDPPRTWPPIRTAAGTNYYTPTRRLATVLNVAFLAPAVVLVWRFRRAGGRGMLAMMDMTPEERAGMGT